MFAIATAKFLNLCLDECVPIPKKKKPPILTLNHSNCFDFELQKQDLGETVAYSAGS